MALSLGPFLRAPGVSTCILDSSACAPENDSKGGTPQNANNGGAPQNDNNGGTAQNDSKGGRHAESPTLSFRTE